MQFQENASLGRTRTEVRTGYRTVHVEHDWCDATLDPSRLRMATLVITGLFSLVAHRVCQARQTRGSRAEVTEPVLLRFKKPRDQHNQSDSCGDKQPEHQTLAAA